MKVETSGSIHDFNWKQRLIWANKIWTENAGFETQQSFEKEKKSPSRSPQKTDRFDTVIHIQLYK
jgi:hypothetical protein